MSMEPHTRPVRSVAREAGHVQEMQRRRLLLAMQELAGEVGLAGATVGQVCKRSRMSRRTFYELFDSRDDCFLAAFEQALEQIGRRVLPVCEQGGRWRDRVRAGLEALLRVFDEQPQLARLCVVETLTGGPVVLARRREILDALAVVVEEGRGEARAGSGPPPLTAESTVGGALAVIHARLLDPDTGSLTRLVPALTGMIVFPYLGSAASQRELERPGPVEPVGTKRRSGGEDCGPASADPFRDLSLRFTYRTARVLSTIAAQPGASNRQVGESAGMTDQGQISKLLKRLELAGLVKNGGAGRESGEPNAWQLTARGQEIDSTLGTGSVS
ncbi:MAG: TetR family transcriptional regulator [Solirubrobacteraceae bacterium]